MPKWYFMYAVKLQISGGDEMMMGSSFGPVIGSVIAEVDSGFEGIDEPFLMVQLVEPETFDDELVEYLVLRPRYRNNDLQTVRTQKCVIWFARVRPGMIKDAMIAVRDENVQTIAVGSSQPVSFKNES